MPASAYLNGASDLTTYGLAASTSTAKVNEASTLIDAHLKRPEGLVWTPDTAGNPCCMATPDPQLTFTLGAPISPGQNVTVQIAGPLSVLEPGEVLVIDRSDKTKIEALKVISNTNGLVIFENVINAHASGAVLASGLLITEQRYMPKNRPIIMAGRTPLIRILSGMGRYAYPRRGDAFGSNTDDFNLLATFSQFGGPPQWEIFNTTQNTGIDPRTGQVWIPSGIMLAYYTEVKLRYVAGFPVSAIPQPIKLATARVIKSLANDPGIGAAKSYRAGDTAIEKFAASILDDDTKDMLRPYRINGVV